MKNEFTLAFLSMGILLVSNAAIAANPVDEPSSQIQPISSPISSTVTVARIRAKLASERLVSAKHINVKIDSYGAVVLSGTVASQAEVNRAGSIAYGVPGVTSVHNTLNIARGHVKPPVETRSPE